VPPSVIVCKSIHSSLPPPKEKMSLPEDAIGIGSIYEGGLTRRPSQK
jgi:hypothetical protein